MIKYFKTLLLECTIKVDQSQYCCYKDVERWIAALSDRDFCSEIFWNQPNGHLTSRFMRTHCTLS